MSRARSNARARRSPRSLLNGVASGLVVLLMGIAPLAHAELYGFVDENGVAHLAARKLDARYRLFVPSGGGYELRNSAQGNAVGGRDRTRLYDALARHPALKRLAPLISKAATRYRVDPALLKAVIAAESGFDADAVSVKGAVGLMQVLPETGERYGLRSDAKRSIADKLTDPTTNVLTGARYLRDLQAMYPERLELVLAAYNAGEGAVRKHAEQIPPYAETREYVSAVLELYRRFDPDGEGAMTQAGGAAGGQIRTPNAKVSGSHGGRLHVVLSAPEGLPVVPASGATGKPAGASAGETASTQARSPGPSASPTGAPPGVAAAQ